ncbi:Crp/Fnr family transcriptional regulator [Geosporobacter ferrireducens]|uniref:Transcriptional regulator n=1 Tax=Geosporobacter ferrireducens TaxID=1424294 RepID=A0A1D8GN67_9FIRM|nr:Crp/Fnr family transcriptional regulator [Geosporobacter ferrireducens]AOT72317.1 transcriptional regulator [Geosporobacter ferrireducens]
MIQYGEILEQTDLFAGIESNDIEAMMGCLNARSMEYEKNEMLLWEGDKVNDIGIVLSGHGRSIKEDISGKTVIVTLLEKGSLIGVLLAASRERRSPVSVQALGHLSVLFIPMENVLKRCTKACARHDRLLRNVLDGIAEKALILHDRNDCLIKPSVREKVLTYLTGLAKAQGSCTITLPFDRCAMAEYLNVDRSALSRELSKMRKDGLIDFYKNNFKLLYNKF